MRKILYIFAIAAVLCFSPNINAQTGYNATIEYCTGTWCQWCPCADNNIHNTLQYYPNTMVLAYHGPPNTSSDPFSFFTGNNIIGLFGFNAYPTGVVNRKTGII